jgi:hypothetical protein
VHPLHGPELRALRPLQGNSPYVFTTEAGTPVTTAWFLRMVQRTGEAAKLPFPAHPPGYAIRRDTNLRMMGTTLDPLLTTWAIAICKAQRGTLRWLREGLRGSGRTDLRSEYGPAASQLGKTRG